MSEWWHPGSHIGIPRRRIQLARVYLQYSFNEKPLAGWREYESTPHHRRCSHTVWYRETGASVWVYVCSPLIRFMRLTISRSGLDSGVLLCLYFIQYKCTTDTHTQTRVRRMRVGKSMSLRVASCSVHGSVYLWWIGVWDVGAQCAD